MLSIENVTKDYGNGKGIKDLCFQVKKGKICAVLGSNGCGKTTTFRVLLQLLEKDHGVIYYDHQVIKKEDHRLFGYVPEERSMLRNLTLEEHIYYLGRLKKMFDDEIENRFISLLSFFQMEEYRNKKISELSKGNQQKVQMMCALIHDPKICIFDEPLNGLDINNVELFKQLLMKLKADNKIILISSHQYNNIENFCDQIIYLKNGKILFQGDVYKLKKEYTYRYLTIRSNLLIQDENILESLIENEYIYLKIKNQESAIYILKKYLNENIEECHMDFISLKDIIKEKDI